MGGADVIPGVSGGTIAFITGIYDELIASIHAIDLEALRLLVRGRIGACWEKVNGWFLLAVMTGILTSIFSVARLMSFLLVRHPIQTWAFFFGLILISAPLVLRNNRFRTIGNVTFFIAGILVAYMITVLTPAQTPNSFVFVFLSGAVAICAMILPGISGAFILLLLGKYEYMMSAITQGQVTILLVFVLGCITGLLSFARLLKWLFANYHRSMVALLAGFMIGSLNKVWPWKQVTMFTIDREGHQVPALDTNILPWDYLQITGKEPLILQALLMAALGIFILVVMDRLALRMKQ